MDSNKGGASEERVGEWEDRAQESKPEAGVWLCEEDSERETEEIIGRRWNLKDFVVSLWFWDKFSLCSPGWPRILYVQRAGLNSRRSSCFCLPNTEIKHTSHHAQLKRFCNPLLLQVWMCVSAHAVTCVWKLEESSWELVVLDHLGPWDWTKVIRLGNVQPYVLNHAMARRVVEKP